MALGRTTIIDPAPRKNTHMTSAARILFPFRSIIMFLNFYFPAQHIVARNFTRDCLQVKA